MDTVWENEIFPLTLSTITGCMPARKVRKIQIILHPHYVPPVDKLLTYGKAEGDAPDQWPNYLELGLDPEQIPDLIRMATDASLYWADSESLEVWAPIHAWRALGQLRAEAAVEPLLSLFEDLEDSDWAFAPGA